MFDPEIDAILKRKSSYLEYVPGCPESGGRARIRCSLNGHELPIDLKAINDYMGTAKYVNLQGIRNLLDNNPSGAFLEDRGHEFFCKLTNRMIGVNALKDLENHINGKRFQRALKKHNEEKEKKSEEGGSDEEMGSASENGDEIEARMLDMMPDSENEQEEEEEKPVDNIPEEKEPKKLKRKGASTKKTKAKKAKKGS